MSFKDQLFKAGLITKKQLRKLNQDEKMERKRKKGTKRKKLVEQAEARAKAKKEKAERLVKIRAERAVREKATMESLKLRQVQQLLNHHRQRFSKGQQIFWHKTIEGTHVHKLWIPSRLAWDLRSGAMAIVAMGKIEDPEYVVIPRDIARRIQDIEPHRVVFLNETPPDENDPAERPYDAD
ncbi:MAG: hypothetical protein CL916_11140 [Deltaproteobacteria bacterium]|nr:hypothetical protein [Deltaproteobacteria bacterium]